jgi:hypothetical protein
LHLALTKTREQVYLTKSVGAANVSSRERVDAIIGVGYPQASTIYQRHWALLLVINKGCWVRTMPSPPWGGIQTFEVAVGEGGLTSLA